MNEQERQLAADHLVTSRRRLLGLVGDLSPEQWAFHPGEGRWSISDCLEHVTRVELRVLGLIGKRLEEPPVGEIPPAIREKDSILMQAIPDRTERRQAPEMARPDGQWSSGSGQLLAEFEKARARSAEFVRETKVDLRSYTYPHGAFGEIDCYQWLLLLGLHSERHARQIEEIRADPAFPAMAVTA
jgi:uncharacterized damage-inducible protein DinB